MPVKLSISAWCTKLILDAPKLCKGMVDKRMNEFTLATNAEYIYIELVDGSQAKIKKSVFASLVRDEIKESFLQNNTKAIEDCNSLDTYENNGLYWINEDTKNVPPLSEYKLAFLFKLT